jgi:ABC-type enterochelin transport system permease subunit
MAIVDWAFAIGGFIAFLGLLLSALSDRIYKSED